jgi:hypothetical protein
MSYASGGLIEATDFNNLGWGGTQGTYTSSPNNVAYVMGVGNGQFGYGQTITALNTVSAGGTVTASTWSGFLTVLNNALQHQGDSALTSNYTSGEVITYLANVATAVTTINTNKGVASTTGSNSSGSLGAHVWSVAGTTGTSAQTDTWTETFTFSSGDTARYFFNAGGRLHQTFAATNNNGTLRSADLVTLVATNTGGNMIAGTTSDGKTGTGGTVDNDSTTLGYWNLTTSDQTLSKIRSTNYRYEYNADFFQVSVKSNGAQGSNGDNGDVITFTYLSSMAGQISASDTSPAVNDAINVTITPSYVIVYPETTYLSDSWGTVTTS